MVVLSRFARNIGQYYLTFSRNNFFSLNSNPDFYFPSVFIVIAKSFLKGFLKCFSSNRYVLPVIGNSVHNKLMHSFMVDIRKT